MSKISELSDGGSLQSTDYLIAVRSGGNVKVQLSELPSGIGAGGNIVFGDNEKAIFGAGSDLQIYHDGSNSYVRDTGVGDLYLAGSNNIYLTDVSFNPMIRLEDTGTGGIVRLYNEGSEKLATTATGIDVTGTVTADGLTVDGDAVIASTVPRLILNETDVTNGNWDFRGSFGNLLIRSLNDDLSTASNKLGVAANGDISFYEDTGTTAKFFWDASAEALGIGTSSPSYKLHVQGTSYFFDQSVFSDKVGIGTTSPAYKLDISDTAGANSISLTRSTSATNNNDSFGNLYWTNSSGDSVASIAAARQSATDDAYLTFNTRTTLGSNTERMRIDSAGNVGLGVTPPAWNSSFKAFQAGRSALFFGRDSDAYEQAGMYSNAVFDATDNRWEYIIDNSGAGLPATAYLQSAGAHEWYTAASGTTGNAISFTQAMTLDASGNLGIGTSSPTAPDGKVLHISDSLSARIHLTDSDFGETSLDGLYLSQIGADSYLYNFENGFMMFATNNSERMRITSAGDVGIGTTSTGGYKLDVNGTARADSLSFRVDGSAPSGDAAIFRPAAGSIALSTNSTERMRIDSGGNVGIGTTSPAYEMELAKGNAGGVGPTLYLHNTVDNIATGHAADIRFNLRNDEATTRNAIIRAQASVGYGTDPNLIFLTSSGSTGTPEERMRLEATGNLLVGSTNAAPSVNNVVGLALLYSGQLQATVDGASAASFNRKTSDGSVINLRKDGTTVGSISVTASATAYNTSSDYRLKDVDGPITNSGAYIDALKPVQGSWKADGSRFIGLIAHEVQEVSETPIATGEKDGEEMQGMDYSAPELISNLIAEIQSLRARVAQLEGV